jgi:hypothetical protein
MFATPVTPDIKVASTDVAVTALTDKFSIDEVTTPAP